MFTDGKNNTIFCLEVSALGDLNKKLKYIAEKKDKQNKIHNVGPFCFQFKVLTCVTSVIWLLRLNYYGIFFLTFYS